MKTIQRIKDYLILLLGGITWKENRENQTNCYMMGRYMALVQVRNYANSLNGMDADDWCKNVYQYISEVIKQVEKHIETEEENDIR